MKPTVRGAWCACACALVAGTACGPSSPPNTARGAIATVGLLGVIYGAVGFGTCKTTKCRGGAGVMVLLGADLMLLAVLTGPSAASAPPARWSPPWSGNEFAVRSRDPVRDALESRAGREVRLSTWSFDDPAAPASSFSVELREAPSAAEAQAMARNVGARADPRVFVVTTDSRVFALRASCAMPDATWRARVEELAKSLDLEPAQGRQRSCSVARR